MCLCRLLTSVADFVAVDKLSEPGGYARSIYHVYFSVVHYTCYVDDNLSTAENITEENKTYTNKHTHSNLSHSNSLILKSCQVLDSYIHITPYKLM